jgi:hypothetical protein
MCVLLLVVPAQATDPGGAMLYAKGTVQVNGKPVTDAIAIMPGDTVHTGDGSSANITATGATMMLGPNTDLTYKPDVIALVHGGVAMGTSSKMRVTLGCINVTPSGTNWTRYEVVDVSGVAKVAARTESVIVENTSLKAISSKSGGSPAGMTLSEGQETVRDEYCAAKSEPAATAISTPFYTSPYFIYSMIGVAAGFTTWILLKCDNPVSPSSPGSSGGSGCH